MFGCKAGVGRLRRLRRSVAMVAKVQLDSFEGWLHDVLLFRTGYIQN
jgi:hypothetical protein